MPSLIRYAKQCCPRLPRIPVRVESAMIAYEPSPEQLTWRRYEDWRIAYDIGMPDSSGRLHRRTAVAIAESYGVTAQAVRAGIRAARRLQVLVQQKVAAQDA